MMMIDISYIVLVYISGYVSSRTGVYIPGGVLVSTTVSLSQCTDLCMTVSTCLAVDYKADTRACYFHPVATYCGQTVSNSLYIHYKKLPCSSSESTFELFACIRTALI